MKFNEAFFEPTWQEKWRKKLAPAMRRALDQKREELLARGKAKQAQLDELEQGVCPNCFSEHYRAGLCSRCPSGQRWYAEYDGRV